MEGREDKTPSKRKRDSSPQSSPSSPRSHVSPKRAPIDFSPPANSVTPQTIQGQLKHSALPQFLIDTKSGMYYDPLRKCHYYWSEEYKSFFYYDDANQSYSFADNQWYQAINSEWQPVSQGPTSTQPQELKDQEKGLFYDVERGCYYEIDRGTSKRRYEGYDGQWYQLDGTQLKLEVDLDGIIENLDVSQLTWQKVDTNMMRATLPGFEGSVSITFIRPHVPAYLTKLGKGSPENLTLLCEETAKGVIATRGNTKNVKASNKAIAEASKMYDSLPAYQPPAPPPTPEELYKNFILGDLLYGLDTDRPRFLESAKGKQSGWKNAYNVVDDLNHQFLGCVSGLAYGEMSKDGQEFLANLPSEQRSVVMDAANTFKKAFEQYIDRRQLELPRGGSNQAIQTRIKRAIKFAIEYTISNNRQIRFLLTSYDIGAATDPSHKHYQSYTSKELRSIYRRRDQLDMTNITFLKGTKQVNAPWIDNPTAWDEYQQRRDKKKQRANTTST